MAEATRDRRLGACRLQKRSGGGIQARTTATGQFSCAGMKLSAAQVFGREDEDGGGAYSDHGPPPPAPLFARAATIAATAAALFATAALAAESTNLLVLQAATAP